MRFPQPVWLSMLSFSFGLVVSVCCVKRNFSGQLERLEPIRQIDACTAHLLPSALRKCSPVVTERASLVPQVQRTFADDSATVLVF